MEESKVHNTIETYQMAKDIFIDKLKKDKHDISTHLFGYLTVLYMTKQIDFNFMQQEYYAILGFKKLYDVL